MYIDDILVASRDISSHVLVLKKVFELMHQNCLEFRVEKCSFAQSHIEYLGYLITAKGISPSSRHVVAIRDYLIPKNIHELNRFVGLASFFRRFIRGFSCIAKPLRDLQKNNVVFKFQENEMNAFQELQKKLISQPLLKLYNSDLETELHTDASKIGYGAILLQRHQNGQLYPISYFSKATTEAESKKHSFELEALVVIYAVKRFHVYLYGNKFKIVTDCRSFEQAIKRKDASSQVMRWSLFLSNYQHEIVQRNGTSMRHVDALSRCPGVMSVSECSFYEILASFQMTDPNIEEIKESILNTTENDFYTIRDNLLYRKFRSKLLLYV